MSQPAHVPWSWKFVFLIGAIVCFVIALLISTGVFTSDTRDSWAIGGLLSLTLYLGPIP